MATAEQVSEFRVSNQAIVDLATQQLTEFLATSPTTKALSDFWVEFVATFGRIAATTAADWFDELRADAGVRAGYTATVADPASPEQALGVLRWATAPKTVFDRVTLSDSEIRARLDAGDTVDSTHETTSRTVPATTEQIGGKLSRASQRLILQAGRETIAQSVARDPARARWARVPSGDTCAFCLMTASRGAVYASEATAGGLHKYHDDCDCTPTPFWRDSPYPDGYDPDALFQLYQDARDGLGKFPSTSAILSELRTQQGIH
ncbi:MULTISPECIES: VG15 protein [Actinomycetes]|uniref:VG15 protein n=1 Tax=Micromonospora sp. NPDC005367 TaxID=3155590 RepID=UPI0033A2ABB8